MKKLISKFFNAKVNPVIVAATGIAAVQTAPAIAADQQLLEVATSTGDPVTIIIQIVLAIASLWKILKKNQNNSTPNE